MLAENPRYQARTTPAPGVVPWGSAQTDTERLDYIEKASACQRRSRRDARGAHGGERRTCRRECASSSSRRRKRSGSGSQPDAGYRIAELYLERRGARSIVGNIYKGKVDNVIPGLEAAFVDIGLEKNGFLHVDEIVLPGVEAPGAGAAAGARSPSC